MSDRFLHYTYDDFNDRTSFRPTGPTVVVQAYRGDLSLDENLSVAASCILYHVESLDMYFVQLEEDSSIIEQGSLEGEDGLDDLLTRWNVQYIGEQDVCSELVDHCYELVQEEI